MTARNVPAPVACAGRPPRLRCRRAGAVALLIVAAAMGRVEPAVASDPFDHQHNLWTAVLREHVRCVREGHQTVVDYAGLKAEARLDEYLASLSSIAKRDFEQWSRQRQLAFLLNVYNAFTVALVAGYYPNIDSIKDIGWWSGPWTYKFVPLFGEKVSLDHIEHELIRGDDGYREPRIHFALNCASASCPALRPEAYTDERLEEQLRDAEARFLTDRTRNRLHVDRQHLEVSKIFDWYGEDFEDGQEDLEGYFARHAELLAEGRAGRQLLRDQRFSVGFGEYDWSLNDVRTGCR